MKFLKYINSISWKNNLDKNIPVDVLKDINDIQCINVVSTCNGHSKKGPSLYFQLNKKDVEYKTFKELKEIYNDILDNLKENLNNTKIKWICWLNPTEFLYDSNTGYNQNILKRYSFDYILNSLCYKTIIQLECVSDDYWWDNVLDALIKLKVYINDKFSIKNYVKFIDKKKSKEIIGMK